MDRNDSGRDQETRQRRDGEGFAARMKVVLKTLDADEFADVVRVVDREQRRRSKQKEPANMSDAEHHSWVADEIKKASRAGKQEASNG